VGKARSLLSGVLFWQALDLLANIKLGLKYLPGKRQKLV